MSKTKVHVHIPYTTEVACGVPYHYATAMYREKVTCRRCRKTEEFKKLPNLPKKYLDKKR